MTKDTAIERIEITTSRFTMHDMGVDRGGFALVYMPGNKREVSAYAIRVHAAGGAVGEYVGCDSTALVQLRKFADLLIGRDALERGRVYSELKRGLRKFDQMGIGMIDIPLWDLAGKVHGASIATLLGGWRKRLPTYASTMAGDHESGGLNSAEAYAAFALQCRELGYKGFKMHIWDDASTRQVIDTVLSVRKAVGPDMDLMLDPGCKLETFHDALAVGQACDEANYMWYEDPYRDGGVSTYSHKMLRERLRTPLCQTEHIRGLEQHVNFVLAGATDFMRADAEYDGGITGAMKIAAAAEGLGLDLELHGPGPMHRHMMSALRNSNYYEMSLVHPKMKDIGRDQVIYGGTYVDALDAVDEDGTVPVPQGPGLGVTYDWDYIKKHAVANLVYP